MQLEKKYVVGSANTILHFFVIQLGKNKLKNGMHLVSFTFMTWKYIKLYELKYELWSATMPRRLRSAPKKRTAKIEVAKYEVPLSKIAKIDRIVL